MLDFGILSLPVLGALAVFTVALFVGDEIIIDKFEVSRQLEWSGYSSSVVTHQLTDELRELNDRAASELSGLKVDPTKVEKGIGAFEDFFQLSSLINGTRNILGLLPYYVDGEVTEKRGEANLVIRIFTKDEAKPVQLVSVVGDPNDMEGLLREGAVKVLEKINPYVIALYYRQTEAAAQQYDFPKTHASVDSYLASRPIEEHYLVYGLLGRAYMIKAERDTTLTPEQKQAEYDKSMRYLDAALRQNPNFLYPLINLALIHMERGENAIAEKYFARAVAVDPNYLITRRSWGDALIKQGRTREAAYQYVAAVEIAPENAELRDKLAQLYLEIGQPDAARDQWRQALLISPTSDAYLARLQAVEGKEACPPGLGTTC